MFSDKYKKDNEKIKLSDNTKYKLLNNVKVSKSMNKKTIISIGATLLIVSSGLILSNKSIFDDLKNNDSISTNITNTDTSDALESLEFDDKNASVSMQEFLSYNGKDYSLIQNNINSANINSIIDKKIGTSSTDENSNLFSNLNNKDVYTLKGYNKNILLAVTNYENEKVIEIFQHYDDNLIKTGKDIIEFMNISNNIIKANSINENGEPVGQDILPFMSDILACLHDAKNIIEDTNLVDKFFSTISEFKTINIELDNGIIRTIHIYREGYMFIDGYIFSITDQNFDKKIYDKI